jgi:iron(III) transport system substrate-binding protein
LFAAPLWAFGLLVSGCSQDAGVAASVGGDHALVVYSSTDRAQFADVVAAFARSHPEIHIRYESLSASDVYERARKEIDSGAPSVDMVINSAMDLQIKLVNDGYAQTYASPERSVLPSWAVWKNQAYAVTSEPIVIGYNKRLVSSADLPRDHDEMASLLHRHGGAFRGRIAMYDPDKSPTGFLYISEDLRIDRDNWDLLGAIGLTNPELYISTSKMIDDVSSGKMLFAYNIIGSYALDRARSDPNFGIIIPKDYVLIGSRVALICRGAPHRAAARTFLDFLLSRDGQAALTHHNMIPLRTDVVRSDLLAHAGNTRAIHVGPALMAGLDRVNRERFFTKWNATVRASSVNDTTKTGRGKT